MQPPSFAVRRVPAGKVNEPAVLPKAADGAAPWQDSLVRGGCNIENQPQQGGPLVSTRQSNRLPREHVDTGVRQLSKLAG